MFAFPRDFGRKEKAVLRDRRSVWGQYNHGCGRMGFYIYISKGAGTGVPEPPFSVNVGAPYRYQLLREVQGCLREEGRMT